MDVEALRAEMEQHLKENPDEDAPDGFRHRFDAVLEKIESGDDGHPKEELEATLLRIRQEAEAAVHAARGGHTDVTPKEEPQTEPVLEGPVPEPGPGDPVVDRPEGSLQRIVFPIAAVVIVLAAAYYFLR